jgi:aminoglycoside phosphotransferase
VEDLLRAAVDHGGGTLLTWQLDHVDAHPQRSTTATYTAVVDWPFGRRNELLGASVRVGGRTETDERAVIFADGQREVAVWLYPRDPDLPGLVRAAYPEQVAALLHAYEITPELVETERVELEMIGYRPRRRAVLRVAVPIEGRRSVFYIKVLRQKLFEPTLRRHQLLLGAGLPAPQVAAATDDCLLVLPQLPGRPLAQAIFDPQPPCTAEQLVGLLDAMPREVATLPRRNPWTDAIDQYAAMVAAALPSLEGRLQWLVDQVRGGLAGIGPGTEPTHGDFHEGQLFVADGRVTGLLDIDTVGPGRRADDLACLIAHLSTVQRMSTVQAARVSQLVRTWMPVFDARVDPVELRLRAAGVVVSLATGPYRGQEPHWEAETEQIVEAAERLVRSAG